MNESKNRNRISKICMTAAMAAIVFVSNYLRITLPIAVGGVTSFTLANILCALSGILLGPGRGFLAAGIGSAIYDLTYPAFVMEAPITFFTKGMYGLIAGAMLHLIFVRVMKKRPERYFPQVIAVACAAAAYLVGYCVKNFFYNGMLIEGYTQAVQCWTVVIAKIPATLVNGALAVIFAPILGVAIRKGLKAAKLDRLLN